MASYEITATMNLKSLISEAREVSKALNDFADDIEQIEKKYNSFEAESKEQEHDIH